MLRETVLFKRESCNRPLNPWPRDSQTLLRRCNASFKENVPCKNWTLTHGLSTMWPDLRRHWETRESRKIKDTIVNVVLSWKKKKKTHVFESLIKDQFRPQATVSDKKWYRRFESIFLQFCNSNLFSSGVDVTQLSRRSFRVTFIK